MRVPDQPAYVLHARPWRETSLIVELLTRDQGRVGLVARGVQGPKRHPLRAALQPLQHVRVEYLQRGELGRLLQAEALDVAPLLQGDTLLAAFYVNELLRIAAVVWVEREGQKPIVIGKGGERLKAIGTGARAGMERLFGRKVFLETWCRVREGWSDDEAALRRFGYSD